MKKMLFNLVLFIGCLGLAFQASAQDFSVKFNGSSSTIIVDSSNIEIKNASGLYFSFWVKADWTAKNFYLFDWADSLNYRSGNDNMRFNLRGIRTGIARFGFYFNSSIPHTVEANMTMHKNEWTLITCVLNPVSIGSVAASYDQRIYVNGILIENDTVMISAINTGNNSLHISRGSHFRIGSRYGEDSSSFFIGELDNFRITELPLTEVELKKITCDKEYKSRNTILDYSLDNGSGVVSTDSSANKADGFLKSCIWSPGAVNVNNRMPILSFNDTTKSPSLGVKLTNTSKYASSFKWTFGDGDSSTSTNVYHSFSKPDTFKVCLNGTNSCGLKGVQVCKDVIIVCPETDATYTFETTGMVSRFSAKTGEKYKYTWDFGDKSYAVSGENLNKQSYSFPDTGTYEVCLVVRSPCGRDTSCKKVAIEFASNLYEIGGNRSIKIFPNPVKDFVNIEGLNSKNAEIKISDVQGRVLRTLNTSEAMVTISSAEMESGIYFITISQNAEMKQYRVIKQ